MIIVCKGRLIVWLLPIACLVVLADLSHCHAQESKIQVAVPSANLFSGSQAVGTASQGQIFEVLQANADWFLISAPVKGQPQKVWIRKSDVKSAVSKQPVSELSTQRFLRVKNDTADVLLGNKAVARLRHGELHPLRKAQGRYYSVRVHVDGLPEEGWILDSHVDVVQASTVGPSLAGHRPATTVEAAATINWKTDSIVLKAPGLSASSREPAIMSPGVLPSNSTNSSVAMSEASLSIETDMHDLSSMLTPGTRSMWLSAKTGNDTTYHRIDLPIPKLLTSIASYTYPTITDGPVLMVPVANLLPGFVVEYSLTPTAPWRSLPRQGDVAPRWLDVYQDKQGEHLRIVMPLLANGSKQSVRLRVRNLDGSASNTIVIDRIGGQVEKAAKVVEDARPVLVETSVSMPDVEVMPLDQAAAQLTAIGLKALPVDDQTLTEVTRENVSTLLVVRQGIAAGEPALVGSRVLLTVASESTLEIGAQPNVPAPIDTADDLGFASLGTAPRPDSSNLDGAITESLARNGIDSAIAEQATVFAIGTDPGVNLDPHRPAQRTQAAAVLRLVLDAIVNQPSWRDLPGPIGKSITECITSHEVELQEAMRDTKHGPAADKMLQFVGTLTDNLRLSLNQPEQKALAAHLLEFAKRRWSPDLLDRNGNGLSADDLAVCGVIWLFEEQQFEPLSHVVVIPSPSGGNVAIVSDRPHNTDWLQSLLPLLFLPGKSEPQIQPPTTPSTKPPIERPLPDGKPLVTVRRGPDEVRVPDVVDRLVGEAEKRLSAFDLRLPDAQKFFQDDRVTASEPEAETWVAATSDVTLNAVRRVPNLVQLSKQQADAEVVRFKFRLNAPRGTMVEDIVIGQDPPHGDYIAVGSAIDVEVAAIVPSVVDALQRDAATTLSKKGLGWRSESKAFGSDKVVAQSPAAGTLIKPGTDILLDLHLEMPNVIGRLLDQAAKTMDDYDLRSEVTTRLARGGDTVRGQTPAAGTYVPHQSLVRLGPVVGSVPNVVGNTIERAQEILSGGDYLSRLQGDLIDDDVVTFQTPRAGSEQERGASIVLDARVQAPSVQGQPMRRAEATIAAAGGRLRVAFEDDFQGSDVVHSQFPAGGEFVYPRSTITLIPGVAIPDLRGLNPDSAYSALAARGLDGRVVSSGTQETEDRNLAGATRIEGQRPASGLYRRRDVGTVGLSAVTYILAERVVPRVDSATEMNVQGAIATIKRAELTPIIVVDGRELNEVAFGVYAITYAAAHDGINLYNNLTGDQNPPAGTRVLKGIRVRFEVRSIEDLRR